MSSFIRNARVALICLLLVPATGLAQDKFFDSNRVRIRYVEQGNGDPIVLIHGFGNTLDNWIASGVLPNLDRDYRVIAFDVRGHGKSGKPPAANAYGSCGRECTPRPPDMRSHSTTPNSRLDPTGFAGGSAADR